MDNNNFKPTGLSTNDAKVRLQRHGSNEVSIEHSSGIKMFLHRFWGLVPWMLEVAIILDLVLQRWVEASIIVTWLAFSALLGFYQEDRAQKAISLLRKRLIINVKVKRDESWQIISASELVPEDLIHLSVGDIVPADIRIVDGQIQIDQSQLTGESLAIERKSGEMAYAGSLVVRGETSGLVLKTGSETYFGKTAELVKLAKAPARLEILITKIARYLTAFDSLLVIAVVVSTLISGTSLISVLPFILLLLIVSVPVAAPMMFTMSATLGSRMLAKNGILVTRLSAIEDAATMNVLCLDKTGTLTENRLMVEKIVTIGSATEDEVVYLAAITSNNAAQNPIDIAILNFAKQKGTTVDLSSKLDYFPFDPNKKYSETVIRQNDRVRRVVMGEPMTIVKLTNKSSTQIENEISKITADGNRVLAVAIGEKSNLEVIGLIALSDPIKSDSKELISKLHQNGLRVLLVTGDNADTAKAVAIKVGITGKLAPQGILKAGMDPKTIEQYEVFAGIYPEEKYFLVKELQKSGYIVGMTGDGVNDAPALKQADVGIAVANSTDVAKAAASLVLTKPGLEAILMSIEGSRRIYQRMQNYVLAMVTRKLSVPTFLAVGVIFFGKFALNPLLMVLHMFMADISTLSLSTDKVIPSLKPDRWAVQSLVKTGLGLAMLLFLLNVTVFKSATNVLHLGIIEAQTLFFVWLVFSAGQSALYATRNRGFFWEKPYPSRWLILASLLDILLVVILSTQGWLMAPIKLSLILITLGLALLFLVIADLLKVILSAKIAYE